MFNIVFLDMTFHELCELAAEAFGGDLEMIVLQIFLFPFVILALPLFVKMGSKGFRKYH